MIRTSLLPSVVTLMVLLPLPAGAQSTIVERDVLISQPQRAAAAKVPEKRSWGPEQATGAPDTPQAGDFPTAWAALHPESGTQWLQVVFEKAVKIAEVRITESLNPGAVVKVSALTADGNEEVIWSGNDLTADAPSDFVVPVQQEITANTVRIYLDTTLSPGWEEIDAVELVAKDGSRQWATSASASSTYAERGGIQPVLAAPPGPFGQFQGKHVTVLLEGNRTVSGTLTAVGDGFMTLQGATTVLVNQQKIVYVEVAP